MKANTIFSKNNQSFRAYVDHVTGAVWVENPDRTFQKSFFKVSDRFYRDFEQTPIKTGFAGDIRYGGRSFTNVWFDELGTWSKDEPTGGPASYYDFPEGWKTWNDLADNKATKQWKEHSFHLGNIGKAIYRWGEKKGTTKLYDAKKIVYSALRVMLMLSGKDEVRDYIEELKNDPQFK